MSDREQAVIPSEPKCWVRTKDCGCPVEVSHYFVLTIDDVISDESRHSTLGTLYVIFRCFCKNNTSAKYFCTRLYPLYSNNG